VDVDCVQDYDLVSENSLYVNNTLTSDEIIFNSAILQDYSESIGNKVLIIDDISDEFNNSVTRTFVTSFNI
jgi:hypoxanthine phosphoribosyltransferase